MAIVTVTPDVESSPSAEDGIYSEGTVINKVEVRPVPGPNKNDELYMDIAVAVPTPSGLVWAHTSPFFRAAHTKLVPGSGSKAYTFLRQLGIDTPESGFDPDTLADTPVVVEIKNDSYTKDGVERKNTLIINITRK